jgi:hypothetical protein
MIFVFIFKKQVMKKYYCKTGNKPLIFINLATTWKRVAFFMLKL